MNINLSKLWEIVKEREAWHTAAHGVAKEPKATELSIHSFTAPRQVLPRWLSGKESACKQETRVESLGWEDALEKGMATQYSILAWEIPWTEEPPQRARVHGVARVKHDLAAKPPQLFPNKLILLVI